MMKKIGIWGYGIAGQAVARHFQREQALIEIHDDRPFTPEQEHAFKEQNIQFHSGQPINFEQFFERNDKVFASPGVDLRPFAQYRHKFITEVDLFAAHWHKPIIAITGSIGKTTVTHLIGTLLPKLGLRSAVGGNIGTGMLDLLTHQETSDLAVLELSSFQLEQCKSLAPDIALITNLHPNHLDRHGTMQEYAQAKSMILAHQKPHQKAIMPLEIVQQMVPPSYAGQLILTASEKPSTQEIAHAPAHGCLIYAHDGMLYAQTNGSTELMLDLNMLPSVTFLENWIHIAATLYALGLQIKSLSDTCDELGLPEHRLEFVCTQHGIDFFNDSKSTTGASTLAAVKKLQKKPIILLLGGLSKGIDRTPLVKELAPLVKSIICFGKEADSLQAMCPRFGIDAVACTTLEEAVETSIKKAIPGDQILLSPAGSSYDLFKDYQDRGNTFKKIVGALN